MVVGILSVFTFNLVDTYFVGKLGAQELTALSFTFPVVTLLASLSLGLGMGVTSVVARAYGSGDEHKVKRLCTDALSLSVIVVSLLATIGLFSINEVFTLLGAQGESLKLITEYMHIWYLGMPFIVIPMVGNGVIRASGNFSFPMWVMLIAGITNIIFDYALIFGELGAPKLGIEGAALATVISRALTLIASLYFLIFKQELVVNPLRGREVFKSWREILETALPSAVMNMISPLAMGVITAFIAPFGGTIVAGFGVGMRIESLALIPILSLSSALNPIIAQNWGASEWERVNLAMKKSCFFSFIWGAAICLILYIFADHFVGLFTNDREILHSGVSFLRISPLGYAAEGIVIYAMIFFVAIGNSSRSLIINFLRYAIFYIPLAYLLAIFWDYKGIYFAKVISTYLTGVIGYFWFLQVRKRITE